MITMGKKIEVSENELVKLINESIGEVMGQRSKADIFDRVMDIQNAKAELGGAMKGVMFKYTLTKDEILKILATLTNYIERTM